MDILVTPPIQDWGGGDEMSEIPSIQNDHQLQRDLISIPARGEYPTTPPTDNGLDLRG